MRGKEVSGQGGNDAAIRRVLSERLFALAGQTFAIALAVLLVSVGLLADAVDTRWLACWFAAGLLVQAVRLVFALRVSRRLEASSSARETVPLPLAPLVAVVCLSGSVWGSLALFWRPDLPLVAQLVIVLFPMAVSVGIVPLYGHRIGTFLAFVVPVHLPMMVTFLTAHDPQLRLLAVPVGVFLLGEIALARHFHLQMHGHVALELQHQSLIDDLSAQRAELLIANEAAHAAAQAKTGFLARMSHELRTPLNGVLGMAELIGRDPLTPSQVERLQQLQGSGQHLLALVDRLLDAVRLKGSELSIEPEDVVLATLLTQVQGAVTPRAQARGLQLDVTVDTGVPESFRGNAMRLEQVLDALLDNACRFTERGSVTLRVAVTGGDRPSLRLLVEDTGSGIESERLDAMFELFAQGDASDTRHHDGAGLGLPMARGIVELMGGTLRGDSAPGGGLRMTVELPLVLCAPARPANGQAGAKMPPMVRRARRSVAWPEVLVVEDNEINRLVLGSLLEDHPVSVRYAHDGQQALDAVAERSPALVLMDCQMPVLDGFEATRRLRKSGHVAPIVAVTANALDGDRERCLAAGMDDHLGKPLAPAALSAMLQRWLGDELSEQRTAA